MEDITVKNCGATINKWIVEQQGRSFEHLALLLKCNVYTIKAIALKNAKPTKEFIDEFCKIVADEEKYKKEHQSSYLTQKHYKICFLISFLVSIFVFLFSFYVYINTSLTEIELGDGYYYTIGELFFIFNLSLFANIFLFFVLRRIQNTRMQDVLGGSVLDSRFVSQDDKTSQA